jgi:SAM-dependent methyltransferase
MIRPGLRDVVEQIVERSPLQKKRLLAHLGRQDAEFWTVADRFVAACDDFLREQGQELGMLADAYLRLCKEVLGEQVRFLKTGRYSATSVASVTAAIYRNDGLMRSYMLGLALTQFLWPNHYAIWKYFGDVTDRLAGRVRKYLEIGAGHGLFLAEAIRRFPDSGFEVIELSPGSIALCQGIVRRLVRMPSELRFVDGDFLAYPATGQRFDLIVMGEILEHVDEPRRFLESARAMLSGHGKLFVTTCSNCPAVDHVYLFHDLDEIRDLVREAGFSLLEERSWPIEHVATRDIAAATLGHNYAALLGPEVTC